MFGKGKKERQQAQQAFEAELAQMLGTADKQEQLNRLRQVCQPTATVVVQVTGSHVNVQAIGCVLDTKDAKKILQLGGLHLDLLEQHARGENDADRGPNIPQG